MTMDCSQPICLGPKRRSLRPLDRPVLDIDRSGVGSVFDRRNPSNQNVPLWRTGSVDSREVFRREAFTALAAELEKQLAITEDIHAATRA